MIPATIAPYVIRAIGERAARRLFTTAESINAPEAKQLGLLTTVCSQNQLDQVVSDVAQNALKNSPMATQLAKKLVFDYADGPVTADMIDGTVKDIANVRNSKEGREGLSAFLEKRKPDWVQ